MPAEWYENEGHIGYDLDGNKIMRRLRPEDRLDAFVDWNDNMSAWRTVYDEVNDEKVKLTPKECDILRRAAAGQFPHADFNQYTPMMRFTKHDEGGIHPLVNPTAPKSGFVPSKWEAQAVIKIVRALRRGDITLPPTEEELEANDIQGYLIWGDDDHAADEQVLSKAQRARKLMHVVAPKVSPPGHAESYNPPSEYLPNEQESLQWRNLASEARPLDFMPHRFVSMRQVSAYENFGPFCRVRTCWCVEDTDVWFYLLVFVCACRTRLPQFVSVLSVA